MELLVSQGSFLGGKVAFWPFVGMGEALISPFSLAVRFRLRRWLRRDRQTP